MSDCSHLDALELRLSHERARFARDGAEIRKAWIAQIEREIERERAFIGVPSDAADMTDDEILAALEAP